MSSLWFLVPAYRRVELSRICFAQHAQACAWLRSRGVDAQVLVIADDENLDAAAQAGLLTAEEPNQLGRRWNRGYQLAARAGIDYVCALGSDNWIDPERFLPQYLPGRGEMLCTRNAVEFSPDGHSVAWLRVLYQGGVGVRCFPTGMLESCRYQPLARDRDRGCDFATLQAIRRHLEPSFRYLELHPFEVVNFHSAPQISSYEQLVERWAVADRARWPFAGLRRHYPAPLIERVEAFYAARAPISVRG